MAKQAANPSEIEGPLRIGSWMGHRFVYIPKSLVTEHPLYRWERMRSLGRRWTGPAVLIFVVGLLDLLATWILTRESFPGQNLSLAIMGYGVPLALGTGWTLRMGQRYTDLRRSGALMELYLTGDPPLLTYGAFMRGNNLRWAGAAIGAPMIVFLVWQMGPQIGLFLVFMAVFVIAFTAHRIWRTPRGHWGFAIGQASWFLLANTPLEQALRFAPYVMISAGWIFSLLMPGGGFGPIFLVFLYGGIFLDVRLRRRLTKLDLDGLQELLRCQAVGEPFEAKAESETGAPST